MFVKACSTISQSLYGVLAISSIKQGKKTRVNISNGTAFMVAPGVLATAAHLVHQETNIKKPNHQQFQVVRSPEIGKGFEKATLIAEDIPRDLALLRIQNPKNAQSVTLLPSTLSKGSQVGSLGFPLSNVKKGKTGPHATLIERFQGMFISNMLTEHHKKRSITWYETDSLMYTGSSGCPGFTPEAIVFGTHTRQITGTKKAPPSKGLHARLAIAHWVPSTDIIAFLKTNGIKI